MATDINTGISDLTTAVTALTVQASTLDATFNLRLSQLATAINNMQPDCGCPGQGTETPTGSVIETDPPPTGYQAWAPEIDERKCKLANMLWDDIYEVTGMLDANDVEAIAALGVGSLTALFGLIVGLLVAGPIAWGLAALGAIAGLIAFFLLESVNLNNLLTIMENYHEELVCAFYNSTNSQDGLDAFKAVLTTAGASAALLAYIDALNLIDSLAVLYFQPDGAMGATIEQRLDGYPMAIDCISCLEPSGEGCIFDTSTGTPYNLVTYGEHPDGQYGGANIFDSAALGWYTSTVNSPVQQWNFRVNNPVYGHPEWANGTPPSPIFWCNIIVTFEILNLATKPQYAFPLGAYGTVVARGPGWSANAYRAPTDGVTPLVTWEEISCGFHPDDEFNVVGLIFYYSAPYSPAPPSGSLKDIHWCVSSPLPVPWE